MTLMIGYGYGSWSCHGVVTDSGLFPALFYSTTCCSNGTTFSQYNIHNDILYVYQILP